MKTLQILKQVFRGQYSYRRRISSPLLQFQGTATFEEIATSRILYHEQGAYKIGELEQMCYQTRFFVFEDSVLRILKQEYIPLHEFPLDKRETLPLVLTHTHTCKNDTYALMIKIHSFDKFSTLYRVRGPSKNFEILTLFLRKA